MRNRAQTKQVRGRRLHDRQEQIAFGSRLLRALQEALEVGDLPVCRH